MTALGLALRWVHLAASIALLGGAVMLLIAGASDRPTARAWHRRVVHAARWLLLVAVLAGIGVVAHQTVVLEGRAAAALDPQALLRVATRTQSGLTWVVRLTLLLVASVFVLGSFRI